MNFLTYTHRDSSIQDLRNFLYPNSFVGVVKGWDYFSFLTFQGDTEITNLERIYTAYTSTEKGENKELYDNLKAHVTEALYLNSNSGDLLLKVGTVLLLDIQYLDREVMITESNQEVRQESYTEFWIDGLRKLLFDKRYQRVSEQSLTKLGLVQDIFPKNTVWLWSKKLSKAYGKTVTGSKSKNVNLEGQIFNLTPFVQEITTSVGANGGSFNLNLAPIVGKYVEGSWNVDESTIIQLSSDHLQYVANSTLHKGSTGFERQNYFFEKIISANDIIFIRFETLEMEIQDRVKGVKDLFIDKSKLPNKVYDMIGLIDSTTVKISPAGQEVKIDVTGRDMMKLLIEDGVYFYPTDFIAGFFGNQQDEESIERLDGRVVMLTQDLVKSIGYSLKFILNGMSTIGVCADSLFDAYARSFEGNINDVSSLQTQNQFAPFLSLKPKDRRSKKFILHTNRQEINDLQQKTNNEVSDLKAATLASISEVKGINGKSGDSEETLNKILPFLEGLEKEKAINQTNGVITGWEKSTLSNKDEVPDSIYDDLFKKTVLVSYSPPKPLKHVERDELTGKTYTTTYYPEGIVNNLDKLKEELSIRNSILDSRQKKLNLMLKRSTTANPYRKTVKDLEKIVQKEVTVAGLEVEIFNKKNPDAQIELDYSLISQSVDHAEALQKAQEDYAYWDEDNARLTGGYTEDEVLDQKELVRLAKKDIAETNKKIQALAKTTYTKKTLPQLTPKEILVFQSAYSYLLKKGVVYSESVIDLEEKTMRGVWQIIKLVIDSNVENKRLVDNTLGNEMGSLVNAIHKICQSPFVEFFGDTYYDQYYFVARKPPTDYVGYKQLKDVAIDIEAHEVINEEFQMEPEEIYSWYRLTPQPLIDGIADESIRTLLKAIRFPEYAYIWGEKSLDQVTNYQDYQASLGANQALPTAYLVRSAVEDLRYLIESHAYAPFVRKGTIQIVGNRTIKRGTVIRYKLTGEVFYVESVGNSYTISGSGINRITTLEVSRGMVEKYFEKYFNIINVDYEKKLTFTEGFGYMDWVTKVFHNWVVNSSENNGLFSNFNFFAAGLQFSDEEYDTKEDVIAVTKRTEKYNAS